MERSPFHRYSEAAMKANVMPVFWDLDPMTQAWIVATVETSELLPQLRSLAEELYPSDKRTGTGSDKN